MAKKYTWVRFREGDVEARTTKILYSEKDMIDDLIKKAIKQMQLDRIKPIHTDIVFNDNVIPGDHRVKQYKTKFERPFTLEPNAAFKRKSRNEIQPIVQKLKPKLQQWKRKRLSTIQALNTLAEESDEIQSRNNQLKFGGAFTSAAVTVGSGVAILATGGLATPFVIVGTGLSLTGTFVTTLAGTANSSHNETQKVKVQKVIDDEKNDYESLRTMIGKVEEHLQNICHLHGWPASDAFPIAVSINSSGVSIPVKIGRFFIAPMVAVELIKDHRKLVKAAADAGKGAEKVLKGAKQLLDLAKQAKVDVAKLDDAIKVVEETARITGKYFITSKQAIASIENTAQVVDNLVDTSKLISPTLANAGKVASATADEAIGIISKGASLVTKAGDIVAEINRVVSPVLGVLGFAMDCYDMYTSYDSAWGSGESEVGKFINEKAEAMKKELKYVEELVEELARNVEINQNPGE